MRTVAVATAGTLVLAGGVILGQQTRQTVKPADLYAWPCGDRWEREHHKPRQPYSLSSQGCGRSG